MNNGFFYKLAQTTKSIRALRYLSKSNDLFVLSEVSLNKNTPSDLLYDLIDDYLRPNYLHPRVVYGVLRNPNVTSDVLDKVFEKDISGYYHFNIASHYKTSPKILEILSNSSDWNVRCFVASNPKISLDILDRLVNDKHHYASKIAKEKRSKRLLNE